MGEPGQKQWDPAVELILANRSKFPQIGKIGAILAQFHNVNGNIALRADFPNPDGLLRHGQAAIVSINRVLKDTIAIPRRATFEAFNKPCVYIVDENNVAHRREIVIQKEEDDLAVVKTGVRAGDKIILDGFGRVHEGDKVEK